MKSSSAGSGASKAGDAAHEVTLDTVWWPNGSAGREIRCITCQPDRLLWQSPPDVPYSWSEEFFASVAEAHQVAMTAAWESSEVPDGEEAPGLVLSASGGEPGAGVALPGPHQEDDTRAAMAPLLLTRCPTDCDPDCEATCHEYHQVTRRREHDPEKCRGVVGADAADSKQERRPSLETGLAYEPGDQDDDGE